MLLWILLFAIVALALLTGALVLSMARAERRARRSLYRALGLSETTVEFLMARNRDVLTELTYVRREGEAKIRREALPRAGNIVTLQSGRRFGRSADPSPKLDDDPAQLGDALPPSDGDTRH